MTDNARSDNLPASRTEWTIKVTEPDGRAYVLAPIGSLHLTRERLADLRRDGKAQRFSLVQRDVTVSEWRNAR